MSKSDIEPVIKVAFKRAEPQLFVTDLARSLSFFADMLGFHVEFSYGDPPFYAQVSRDSAYVNLRCVHEPPVERSLAHREDYLAASICVDSIQELFLEWQSQGVEFHHVLHTEPWGARTFMIVDPDGNLILFGE